MADPTPDIEGETPGAAPDADVHAEAVKRFDNIITAVQEERALALRDRRFCTIAGAQWEGDWAEQFANSIMVEVNKTAQGVEKIIADYRANRMIVDFRAVDKDADDGTADTLDGMFRADFVASKGQQATDNAFDEAVQGGIGAWRLKNVYEDEYDPENDGQRIAFEMIPDADQSVFWDPNAKLYDKSDAKYAFVLTAYSPEAFCGEFGEERYADWPDGLTKPYYEWFTPNIVKVAEYYRVEERSGLLRILRHKATGEERREWAADLTPKDFADLQAEGWVQDRTRKAKRRIVYKYVLSGMEVLKPRQLIAGPNIPVVPVYGKRWFIDNMERSCGQVRRAVDPQRIYNAQISKLTETSAQAPIERPIFTPEQVAGHEQSWAEANLNRAPYALINPTIGPDGSTMPNGPIGKIDPPQVSPALAALVQITASDIADLTSADDGADDTKSNVSAEAMDLAATRTDAKALIYIDNMRQSWQRCGEIWLGMAKDVYVEEGREVETVSEDGKQLGTAVLGEGHTDDKGRYSVRNDISRGRYKVISDVSEATTTRRDKTVRTLVNVAEIAAPFDPDLAGVSLSTALVNMDGEGMTDLQAYLRAKLVSMGAIKPTPEEKAELQQSQQAQQQQPDPNAVLAQAAAEKEKALAGKAMADTDLSKAKTVLTLAQAHGEHADAKHTHSATHHEGMEKRVGILEKVRGMFAPKPTA